MSLYNFVTISQEKFVEESISSFNQFSSKISSPELFFLLLFVSNIRYKGLKLKLSSLLFPVSKLGRENTQLENMCDIVFEVVVRQ